MCLYGSQCNYGNADFDNLCTGCGECSCEPDVYDYAEAMTYTRTEALSLLQEALDALPSGDLKANVTLFRTWVEIGKNWNDKIEGECGHEN